MAKSNRSNRNEWGVLELAREKPIAAAATAVGAAAAGLFLWSKRTRISGQLNELSEKFGQWTESMRANGIDLEVASGTTPSAPRSATASSPRRSAARRKTAPSEPVAVDEIPAT